MLVLPKTVGQTERQRAACFSSLVVELVEVLHVAEDDVFLVDDPWRNLLHPTGHLPQVRLERERERE